MDPKERPRKFMSIVQHNCVSNSHISHTLFSELVKSLMDDVCIQDPPLFNDIPLAASGFDAIFPPNRTGGKTRVATFISKNLSSISFLPIFVDRDNIIATSFFLKKRGPHYQQHLDRLMVVNVYNRKKRSSHCITPDRIFHDAPCGPTLIMGNFNMHNPTTDPSRLFNNNEIGESILYFQLSSRLGF